MIELDDGVKRMLERSNFYSLGHGVGQNFNGFTVKTEVVPMRIFQYFITNLFLQKDKEEKNRENFLITLLNLFLKNIFFIGQNMYLKQIKALICCLLLGKLSVLANP